MKPLLGDWSINTPQIEGLWQSEAYFPPSGSGGM